MAHIEIIIPRRRRTMDSISRKELDALYEDLFERAWAALKMLGVKTTDGEWREDLHPRASNGKFGVKSGGAVAHHGLQPAPKPGPADLKETTAKGKLHELLASGHEWSKAELMEIAGITNEKTFASWLSMFKKPELSGGRKALVIVKSKEGMYRVALPDGTPAPPKPTPPRVEMPTPTPAPTPAPKSKEQQALEEAGKQWTRTTNSERYGIVVKAFPGESQERHEQLARRPWDAIGSHGQARIAREMGHLEKPQAPPAPAAKKKGEFPFEWKPAKTGKEATRRAIDEGWVTHAEFGTMSPENANAIMGSMAAHLNEFPLLQGEARNWYIGSNSGWKRDSVAIQTDLVTKRMQSQGKTPEEIAANLRYWVRAPRIGGKSWATAWDATAQQKTRAVAFNASNLKASEAEKFNAVLKRSADMRWHPPGCDTVKSIMDHEMGHQLDYMLKLRANPDILALHRDARDPEKTGIYKDPSKPTAVTQQMREKQAMTANVSTYAATNVAEFIAEAWAEAKNNPNPRPHAKRLAEIVRREYAQQKHHIEARQAAQA